MGLTITKHSYHFVKWFQDDHVIKLLWPQSRFAAANFTEKFTVESSWLYDVQHSL